MQFLTHLFDTSDFPPRWNCGHWTSGHGWLHILSDLGVWTAYLAIPCVLLFFLKRKDLPFRNIFILFGAFILLCGTTHLMEAIIFWWPAYRLAGLLKLVTALVSWATVFALIPTVPFVLALGSPEELELEIAGRKRAEEALQRTNEELENRIELRTTELKQTLAALERERELLSITLTSIGDAVITTDAEGRITSLNAVAESLTRWPVAEAMGQNLDMVFRIVNAASGQTVPSPVEKALQEGVIVGLANHTILIAKDGTELPIDDSAAPIRTKENEIVGCVLVFRDVTDRQHLEQLNAERLTIAGRLASIVDSSEDAIISKSIDGIIQHWNGAAERLFGYTPEQAVGRHISLLIPPDRADEEERIIACLMAGERIEHYDTVRLRNDGQRLQVSLTISAVKNQEGQIVGASKIVRDITERKRMEDELRELATDLSEADHRKDEFLATLAHELRNPLAPIRNGLQLMKLAGGQDEVIERIHSMMERQLTQMVRLVDDLMDVSRISRGKLELRKERIPLLEVLNSAVETSRPLINEMGNKLTISLPEQPVLIDGDMTRLAQVFLNLLNNAAKYSDQGGHIELVAKVEWRVVSDENEDTRLAAIPSPLATHQSPLATPFVVVSVKDAGIGIAVDQLTKIFQMFTQVDRSLEKSQGGLGIGLSLVKSLVEMHGGTVEAHSDGPGTGSEFVVYLPIARDRQQSQHYDAEEEQDVRSALRILVVDDNRDSADSLAMLLRVMGNEVRTAYDGQAGVDAAKEYRPNVVLLDIGLPKLNGYEACRDIRKQPWGKSTVLIAATGWGQEEDRRRSQEAGFDHHMVKPVNPRVLMKLLANLKVEMQ